MSERLQKALRELALALEEVDSESWELVTSEPGTTSVSETLTESLPKARDKVEPAHSTSSLGTGATASNIAYHEDYRHYIITKHPLNQVGYLSGPGATTWKKLEKTLPGNRLAGSGARLRRVESREEAQRIWTMAFGQIPMPNLEL